MDYVVELAFAKELAREAGKIMQKYFLSDAADVQVKRDDTPVTAADTEINRMVIERVKAEFPTYSIHGEEESHHVERPNGTWVCDPVDGTMPFSKGVPISTFSLGLVNKDGESVVGVVYDPFYDRMYEATKDGGARLNGTAITTSDLAMLNLSYIDEELWINEQEGISFDDPKDALIKQGARVTTMCSVCMTGCLVASGEYEAMLFGQTKPEDIAALAVIVTEAGGKVTDLFGRPQRYDQPIRGAIVSNGRIHNELVAILAKINYQNPYNV